jgi:hypothetical protein
MSIYADQCQRTALRPGIFAGVQFPCILLGPNPWRCRMPKPPLFSSRTLLQMYFGMKTSSESKESIRHQSPILRRNVMRGDGPGSGKMDKANIFPPCPILLPNVRLEEVVGNRLTANVNLCPDRFPIPRRSQCRDLSPIRPLSLSHSTRLQIP